MKAIDKIGLKYITAQYHLNEMIKLNKELNKTIQEMTEWNKELVLEMARIRSQLHLTK